MTLNECGDVLTVKQLCAILQISDRQYRHLRQHGAWKIPHITGFPHRFSAQVVAQFIHAGEPARLLRRVS